MVFENIKELDKTDQKILKELSMNSRIPISRIAKSARVSKQTCHYRIKKMEEIGLIKGYKTKINSAKLGQSTYAIYLRILSTESEEEDRIILDLCAEKNTRWVVKCTGKWDLMVAVNAKNNDEFNTILKKIIKHINKYLIDYETSIILATNDLWLRRDKSNELKETADEKQIIVDEKDKKILNYLTENARVELTKIYKDVGLTPEGIAHRIKKMKKQGIIHSYDLKINQEMLNLTWYQIQLLLTNIDDREEKKIINLIKNMKGTSYLVKTLGKWNLELHFYCQNTAEFRTYLSSIRNLLGDKLRLYEVAIILKKYKSKTLI